MRWQNGCVDPEVFEFFAAGDEQAVKSVYNRYSGAVYSLSLSILRDPELAADATQQTFIKAWRSAAKFEVDREFAPWIYAIARRTAIDIYRRESRSRPSEDVDTVALAPSMELIWEVFEVRAAVDQLSDEEREVIKMSHFEGLTHVEMAEKLDIPIGTVKSRSHRAHRNLLLLLAHLEEPS